MRDCCPLCSTAFEHRVGRGLELRRFPRGRLVCPHDLKGWHLKLEAVGREIDLCRDAPRAAHLRSEFEDMLLQHMGNPIQLEPVNLKPPSLETPNLEPLNLEPLETA